MVRPELLRRLLLILVRHHLPYVLLLPTCLVMEVARQVLTSNKVDSIATEKALHALGIRQILLISLLIKQLPCKVTEQNGRRLLKWLDAVNEFGQR